MTRIIGRPNNYGPAVPLKLVIREDVPYRTPDLGVSIGYYEAIWEGDKWVANGAELNVLMPRYDQPDAQALGATHLFISRTDTGAVVGRYSYGAGEWVETGPGVFDLSKGGWARAWVRPSDFEDLTQGAGEATAEARAAAQSVTAAQLDLSKERGAVAQALADTAQVQTELAVQVSAQIAASEATGARAVALAQAAGAEALNKSAPDVVFLYESQREETASPQNTVAYTLQTRRYHQRIDGKWLLVAEGTAAASEVQPLRLGAVEELAALPFVPTPGQPLMVGGTRGGRFTVTAANNAPPVDNGIVFDVGGGMVAKREREGRVRGAWYGLVPDGSLETKGAGTDNAAALIALFTAINRYGGLIDIDPGTYRSTRRTPRLNSSKPFRLEAAGAEFAFDVQDLGVSLGEPMFFVEGKKNWYADVGLIRQLGLPIPSEDMSKQLDSAMLAPEGWGEPFRLFHNGPTKRYWRTHNDHGFYVLDCSDYELHVRVDAVRGMGVVGKNSQRGLVYARVKNTLADGFHFHGGSSGNRVYVDADTTADDGVAFIAKAGEPPMLDNWIDATSRNSMARGINVSGTQNTHLARADARDAYSEGVVILAEGIEGVNTLYTRVGEVFVTGCCRREDRVENGTAAFRIGYPNTGRGELYNEIGSVRAINNHGPGINIGGQFNRIGKIHSQGNVGRDVIQSQGDLLVDELTCEDGGGLLLQDLVAPIIGTLISRRNKGFGVHFQNTIGGQIGKLRCYENTDRGVYFSDGARDNSADWVEIRNNGAALPEEGRYQFGSSDNSSNNSFKGGTVIRESKSPGGQLLAPFHLSDMEFVGFDAAVPPFAISSSALAGSRWRRLRGFGLQAGISLEGAPYGTMPAFANATEFTLAPFRTRIHVTERNGAKLDGLNVRRADGRTTDYMVMAPNARTLDLEPGDVLSVYQNGQAGGSVTWLWEIAE